jgi:hypothetical protein
MPGGFPAEGPLSNGTNLAFNLVVPPGATANTKGSYVQVSASCPIDACAVLVQIISNPQGVNQTLIAMDIAIGAPGSETVIIPNILVDTGAQGGQTEFSAKFPIQIAKGTRIAARSQTNIAAGANYLTLQVDVFDGEFTKSEGFGIADAIGISGSPLLGTSVVPNALSTVNGAYSPLIPSTIVNYYGFVMNMDMRGVPGGDLAYWVDLALGPPGSEVTIFPHFMFVAKASSMLCPNTSFISMFIPAGSRIAARCASSTTGDTHTIGVGLYGVH